jgi:hypothetical protein
MVSYIDIFCLLRTAINYRPRQVFFGALLENLKNSWTT